MPRNRLKSIKRRCAKLRRIKKVNQEAKEIKNCESKNRLELNKLNIRNEIKDFVIKIIKRYVLKSGYDIEEELAQKCRHFNIGSASIYKFLFKKFSMKNLHQMYNTGYNRQFGRIAENLVLKKNPHIKKGFCLFSKQFPFLCASPDGIIGFLNRK